MKNAVIISATIAIMMFLTGEVAASDFKIDSGKNFAEQRRFVIPIKIPHGTKDNPRDFYAKRYPPRPKPHYMPSKPKPSRDFRGGRGKFVPQAPFK